ncbi:hypothetical protein ACFYKX_25440 [Cytobacillus sp. FJAT-54145]|uniref:Uncharacterized protein n=1 Tax=Cytobacillus spartinae TaxID=3299023 RepID=A0ABW6KM56_9BACI
MSNFSKGYNTEQLIMEKEIIQALRNYEAEYGTDALNELIEKSKNEQA